MSPAIILSIHVGAYTHEINEPIMAGPLHARKSSTGWGRLKPVSDPLDSVGFTSKGDTRCVRFLDKHVNLNLLTSIDFLKRKPRNHITVK